MWSTWFSLDKILHTLYDIKAYDCFSRNRVPSAQQSYGRRFCKTYSALYWYGSPCTSRKRIHNRANLLLKHVSGHGSEGKIKLE